MVNDNALVIKNISVCFDGFYALTDVNANVKRNSIHFFIGPNGAGKTTLLDIIPVILVDQICEFTRWKLHSISYFCI